MSAWWRGWTKLKSSYQKSHVLHSQVISSLFSFVGFCLNVYFANVKNVDKIAMYVVHLMLAIFILSWICMIFKYRWTPYDGYILLFKKNHKTNNFYITLFNWLGFQKLCAFLFKSNKKFGFINLKNISMYDI